MQGPPGTITTLLPSGLKASFTTDIRPAQVELLSESSTTFSVALLTTALEVTWQSPTRDIGLEYYARLEAQEACQALKDRELCGMKLTPVLKSNFEGDFRWSVKLPHAIDSIDEKAIRDLLPAHGFLDPDHVSKSKLAYSPTTDGLSLIKAKIAALTSKRIVTERLLPQPTPLKYKAEIEFEGIPNLDSLAKELSCTQVEPIGSVTAVERVLVMLTLDRRTYNARSRQLRGAAAQAWRKFRIQIYIEDAIPDKSCAHSSKPVEITIKGTDRHFIVKAKALLDEVLGRKLDAEIQQAYKQTHRIRLTKTAVYKQATKRIAKVQNMLGMQYVLLDEESDPPAVAVRGDGAAVALAKKILYAPEAPKTEAAELCAICWEGSHDLVRLACGHTTCTDCLGTYCLSTLATNSSLTCFGTDCSDLIPFRQLEKALPRKLFNDILDVAAASKLRLEEAAVVRCIGPNCQSFLPAGAFQEYVICSTCFTVNCTSCQTEYHFGLTCEAYRRLLSESAAEREFNEYAKKAGFKNCPQCNATLELGIGCTHVKCWGCQSHLCWVCLGIFDPGEVYAHMTREHGSWYLNPEAQRAAEARVMNDEGGGW